MSVVTVAIYDLSDGRILWTTTCQEENVAYQEHPDIPSGRVECSEAVNGQDHYVDTSGEVPAIVDRPTLAFDKTEIVADGVDVAKLVLPDPCNVEIDGVVHTIEGGLLELTATVPARYRVRVDQFPYRQLDVEIVAL